MVRIRSERWTTRSNRPVFSQDPLKKRRLNPALQSGSPPMRGRLAGLILAVLTLVTLFSVSRTAHAQPPSL